MSVAGPRPLWADDAIPRIGISSCLLGSEVRWDGGHKRSAFLTEVLEPFVEWVPVCPEVELGLGTPREPIRLVRVKAAPERLRLVGVKSGADHTTAMERHAARRARGLAAEDLAGFVLKKDSPSCGMERVKVHPEACPMREVGPPKREGSGLFATALMERLPSLPVEEEGRLQDPMLRENWIERVFAYRRLRSFFAGRWTVGGLVAFHTAHKLQLMAHSPKTYRELGRLVGDAKGAPRAEFRDSYERAFMAGLAQKATPRRHVNVLEHVLGYFRELLDPEVRAELHALVADYRAGVVPLIVPITLVRHYVHRLGLDYLAGQVYLDPHPRELMLRNHV